jgi:transcriptional regulator with XRE-family HTH domain
MTIEYNDLKKQWLKNPQFVKALCNLKPEFEMAREFIQARIHANMTQKDVAKKMGTTQSVIARLEGGKATPSMKTIQKFGKAVKMKPEFHFIPLKKTSTK